MPKKKTEKSEEQSTEEKLDQVKKQIAEKAKALAEKIEAKDEKINKADRNKAEKELDVDEKMQKADLLVPLEKYVESGIHLGTKVITEQMKEYVFKRRADGLAILNTTIIDQKLRNAAKMLSAYSPDEIIVSGKREAGWSALKAFSEATGIRVFTKKYPAGIITNTSLPDFFEPKLMFIVDPWLDKNPLNDAIHINIPIISLCDTNNISSNIDLVIPCNNKSNKSIGLVFWILATEYNKIRKIESKVPPISEFVGE